MARVRAAVKQAQAAREQQEQEEEQAARAVQAWERDRRMHPSCADDIAVQKADVQAWWLQVPARFLASAPRCLPSGVCLSLACVASLEPEAVSQGERGWPGLLVAQCYQKVGPEVSRLIRRAIL